jgi:hypothetical protein
MAEKPQSYYGTWINRQRSLLPGLDEELDPLTAKLEHLIVILDTLGLEAFVAPPSRGRGRPPDDRPAIARSFVAKAVLTIPTTSALIERLQIDRALRRICGWERRSEVPSEATFSRAFAEFAAQGLPERVHEQLVRRHLHDHIVGHISRDATEIEAREKPRRRSSDDPPPPAPRKRERGRPRNHEVLPPKPLTRIEQQRTQSLDEMRAGLPTQCDVGVKRNSKGFRETWIGYKLHLDTANGIVPVAAILTAASIHDSQVAIPLARTSEQRVVWLYDLMDSAYDAQPIINDCLAAGRVPVIDRNTRRDTALKAEIAAERARRRLIKVPDPRDLTYNERTTAERANARIKDEFGGRHLRVRGHLKAFCHLMFGVVALAADSIVRLFSARFYIRPA